MRFALFAVLCILLAVSVVGHIQSLKSFFKLSKSKELVTDDQSLIGDFTEDGEMISAKQLEQDSEGAGQKKRCRLCCEDKQIPTAVVYDLSENENHGNYLTIKSCDGKTLFGYVGAGAFETKICIESGQKFSYSVSGGKAVPNVLFGVLDYEGIAFENSTHNLIQAIHSSVPPYFGKSRACGKCGQGHKSVISFVSFEPSEENPISHVEFKTCSHERVNGGVQDLSRFIFSGRSYHVSHVCRPREFYLASDQYGAHFSTQEYDFNLEYVSSAEADEHGEIYNGCF